MVFALIDIDGYHEINDALGRAGGDTMLRTIAERLKSALPPGAVLGRFQDDEFAAIVASEDAQIAHAARRQNFGVARRADLHGSAMADQRRHRVGAVARRTG